MQTWRAWAVLRSRFASLDLVHGHPIVVGHSVEDELFRHLGAGASRADLVGGALDHLQGDGALSELRVGDYAVQGALQLADVAVDALGQELQALGRYFMPRELRLEPKDRQAGL